MPSITIAPGSRAFGTRLFIRSEPQRVAISFEHARDESVRPARLRRGRIELHAPFLAQAIAGDDVTYPEPLSSGDLRSRVGNRVSAPTLDCFEHAIRIPAQLLEAKHETPLLELGTHETHTEKHI